MSIEMQTSPGRTPLVSHRDLRGGAGPGSLVRQLDALLSQAIACRASDVHFERAREQMRVRFRIDGRLERAGEFSVNTGDVVSSRLKILAGLDIAEKRRPQDGRFSIDSSGKKVDIRLSTMPTRYGEKVVLRILDRESQRLSLTDLGLEGDARAHFDAGIRSSNGLVLVTGPTGSGKTTTLYAALQEISSSELNILTVEDPVEYELAGINQTQVHPEIGLTFSSVLRSFLRQDPDVVMVGEIRDHETASIAVRAALTGHLVFSTLHTNDAPSAVSRLVDMGIEPFLLSASLRLVVAQRLIRRLCESCGGMVDQNGQAESCAACRGSGFRGRLGVFEVLPITDSIRSAVNDHQPTSLIRETARREGMKTLAEAGEGLVIRGCTSRTEFRRVLL